MPARIKEICEIASSYGLPVVEDAAEALGSGSNGKFMGSFGICGVFSFNANKIITSGGGGMIVTDDKHIYDRLMHLTKTSKIPHRYEFIHDEIGYNYRLPNVNACIGLAQFEQIHHILRIKQHLAGIGVISLRQRGYPLVKDIKRHLKQLVDRYRNEIKTATRSFS